jgi:hypothetical protein
MAKVGDAQVAVFSHVKLWSELCSSEGREGSNVNRI